MTPNTSEFRRGRLLWLVSFILIGCTSCRHRATTWEVPQPPAMGGTLVVEFAWVADPEDKLDVARSVSLSGRQLSMARDSRFTACFGPGKRVAGCQAVDDFYTTTAATPDLEFHGTRTITTAQPGNWEIYAAGESSGGANASQVCSVYVQSGRLVTLKMTLGVDPDCTVL